MARRKKGFDGTYANKQSGTTLEREIGNTTFRTEMDRGRVKSAKKMGSNYYQSSGDEIYKGRGHVNSRKSASDVRRQQARIKRLAKTAGGRHAGLIARALSAGNARAGYLRLAIGGGH